MYVDSFKVTFNDYFIMLFYYLLLLLFLFFWSGHEVLNLHRQLEKIRIRKFVISTSISQVDICIIIT